MELALVEVAKQDQEFRKYMNTEGGAWKKWKYDALYRIAEKFTEEYVPVAAKSSPKMSFGKPSSQED